MFCVKCGRKAEEEARFCCMCGAALRGRETEGATDNGQDVGHERWQGEDSGGCSKAQVREQSSLVASITSERRAGSTVTIIDIYV